MKSRVYAVLDMLVTTSLVLAACTPSATPEPTSAPTQAANTAVPAPTAENATAVPATPTASPEHEPVTIRYSDYSQERTDFYKAAATEFSKEYPWITVNVETLTEDDYKNTLPLMFKGGDAPDIFVYTWPSAGDYFELPELLRNGWVQPLDDTALPADFRQRFPGTGDMMEGIFSQDGKVYTIPRPPSNGAAGYAYMYYNKALVQSAGLTDKIPTTWTEFADACKTIKETTGAYCFAAALKEPRELDRIIIPLMSAWVPGFSDSMISYRTGKYTVATDPQFVKALEFLRQLYVDGYALPGQNDKVFSRQAVANGEAAFYFDGGWMSSVFPNSFAFSDFGVAIPPGPEQSAPQGYLGKIASGPPLPQTFISSLSQHPYEATLFLEWVTRPDGWYTQHFMEQGFDFLPWGDPIKNASYMPADNATRDLAPLDPLVHVMAPQASLKCPDLAQSTARTAAEELQPDAEWQMMVEYLVNGGDWLAKIQPVEDAKNQVFEATLTDEAAQGLKVSVDCFAEPNWDGLTDFDYSVYAAK